MPNKDHNLSRAKMFFYAGLGVTVVGFLSMDSILPLAWLLFVVTGYYYGQVKGYTSMVGAALGFFGAVGLGVLLFLPDKNLLAPADDSDDSHTSS